LDFLLFLLADDFGLSSIFEDFFGFLAIIFNTPDMLFTPGINECDEQHF
jgi:hypothetical protein